MEKRARLNFVSANPRWQPPTQDHQIEIERAKLAHIAPIATWAAALFYDSVFSAEAFLKPRFRGDSVNPGERLAAAIGSAVKLLEPPAKLIPELQSLGQRHAGCGVQICPCGTVGGALWKTREQGLGAAATEPVKPVKPDWPVACGLLPPTLLTRPLGPATGKPRRGAVSWGGVLEALTPAAARLRAGGPFTAHLKTWPATLKANACKWPTSRAWLACRCPPFRGHSAAAL